MLDMTTASKLPPRFLPFIAALLMAAGAASCAAPIQNGGVETTPGAAARLGMLCHFGHDVAGVCGGLDEVASAEPAAPLPVEPPSVTTGGLRWGSPAAVLEGPLPQLPPPQTPSVRDSSGAAPFPAAPDATGAEARP
jgi:hypothetical protein